MRVTLAAAVALLSLLFWFRSAQAEALVLATEGAYPPFNTLDDSGKPSGFDVDMGMAMCRLMQVPCRFVVFPWDELIPALERGDCDAVVACMAWSAKREERVDFTDHYFRSRTGFVGRKDSPRDISPPGLRGKTLATQNGTTQFDFLQQTYGRESRILGCATMPEALAAVARGEVDLVLAPYLAAYAFLLTPEGEALDFIGEALPSEVFPYSPAHIAVRQGDDGLRQRLNQALEDIRLSGEYDRINREYFPFSIY